MKKETKDKILNNSLLGLQLVLIIVFFEAFPLHKAFIFTILMFVFIAGIRAIMMREQIRNVVHYIESLLFGKPLNRYYWKKGEKPKLKVKK